LSPRRTMKEAAQHAMNVQIIKKLPMKQQRI